MDDLARKRCVPCEGGTPPLSSERIGELMGLLSDWELQEGRLTKLFRFDGYLQAVAFVNAVAWVSHREDHHPLMELGYNTVRVSYWTHAIGGLSENDFICAAKVDQFLGQV